MELEKDSFRKYHKIKILGDRDNKGIFDNPLEKIYIQEKMDGANFRFRILNCDFIFGSRTQQLTSNKGEETNVPKNFKRCIDYIKEKISRNRIIIPEDYVFFGEAMHKHTMGYDWEKVPPFLGFDIWDSKKGVWLDYPIVADIYQGLGLDVVPLIDVVEAKDIIKVDDSIVPQSRYSIDFAEGVVFKNYDKQLFAKYVRPKFKEESRKNFGNIAKYADSDEGYFVAKYCTNARIEKMIYKLLDEGYELSRELMKYLPQCVYLDIWEENLLKIIMSKDKTINLRKFNKGVSKRCFTVLNNLITNEVINGDM